MSAPRTDVDKQKRRHFTPLVGIGLALVAGLAFFLLYIFTAVDDARGPDDGAAETQVTAPPGSENVGDVDVVQEEDASGSETDEPETSSD